MSYIGEKVTLKMSNAYCKEEHIARMDVGCSFSCPREQSAVGALNEVSSVAAGRRL